MNGKVDKTQIYMEAGLKGAEWLVSRQEKDGSICKAFGVAGMYKTVWALVSAGKIVEASRLLDWAKKNIMTQPGEFHFSNETEADKSRFLYRNSYILIGAYKIGRFDIASEEAIKQLMRYQDTSGGFYANLDDKKEKKPINLLFTTLGAWTCLYFGKLDAAIKTGDFIINNILEPQPEFDRKYYVTWDPKTGKLITDIKPGEEMSRYVDSEKPIGPFYHSGVAAGFLAELFERTGEARFLEGAKKSMSFSYNTLPESYHFPSKCKDGWGAAVLYRQTKDPKHREIAEKVADITFLEAQFEDGGFRDFLYPANPDGSGSISSAVEITSEFTFELIEIAKSLTED